MHFLYTHKDILEVIGAGAFGLTVSFNMVDHGLRLTLTVLSIGFIIYKWIKETKK